MKDEREVRVVLTDAAGEVVARVRATAGRRAVARDRQRMLRLDGAVPVRRLHARAERARGGGAGGRADLLDERIARSFEGREVVVDAGDDPQPDSFSCESELGYRFFLERLPAV